WLRAMPVVQSGDQVRVHATGTGFSITSEGFALNSATAGQQVKVRVESGRVVTGIARPGRIAEIHL
ncbi:MAG: flagellar basal body P-ring formation chaperone FlgA, partial [Usitatibacteraceae bacterium]